MYGGAVGCVQEPSMVLCHLCLPSSVDSSISHSQKLFYLPPLPTKLPFNPPNPIAAGVIFSTPDTTCVIVVPSCPPIRNDGDSLEDPQSKAEKDVPLVLLALLALLAFSAQILTVSSTVLAHRLSGLDGVTLF